MDLIEILNYKKTSKVDKAKNGDKEAFLYLINENKLNIYRVAKGMLRKEEDIEDAIQNTIIKAFEKVRTLKDNSLFRTWIIRILINECNEILRKSKKLISFEESACEENYNDIYENMDLTNAINLLSEEFKVTTILFYFEDMSIKEISKFLDVPEGTIRSRLTRSREKLREIMSEV